MEAMGTKKFPYKIQDVEPEVADEIMKLFKGERTGFVQVGPKKYFMPHKYRQEAAHIYNMELRPTDVFVMSYPRSGTTWTQELVWLVVNDLDYAAAAASLLEQRCPLLEFNCTMHPEVLKEMREEGKDNPSVLEFLSALTLPLQLAPASPSTSEPRFFKTHLPLSLLPPDLLTVARAVYVARDPRDVAVSFYHLDKSLCFRGFVGDFKTFWRFYKEGLYPWGPYFEHLKEAWAARHHPHMLFLFYEDMSKDLPATIQRVSSFFGKSFTAEQVTTLCEHLSFENFRNNPAVNNDFLLDLGVMQDRSFVRKGKSGGWREYFDGELAAEARLWMSEHLRGTDLRFPHIHDTELGLNTTFEPKS